jgi:hypothetical protein
MSNSTKGKQSQPRSGSAPAGPIPTPPSRALSRVGWGISVLIAVFCLVDGGGRVVGLAPYVEGLVKFGFAPRLGPAIGLALIISTLLYLLPRSAVLGAILMTGYLGGATAVQVRAEDPWFLFPVVFGVLTWAALYLRDPAVRALLPLNRANQA